MILNKGLLLQPFQKYTGKSDEMVNSVVFLLSEGSKWKLMRLYPGFFMPLKTLFCCFLHMIMYGLKSIKK